MKDNAMKDSAGGPPRDKAGLRQWMGARLKAADTGELRRADELICRHLRQLPRFKQATSVLAYAPMAGELDIWPLLAELAGSGRLTLPLITGPGQMEARQVSDLAQLVTSRYGIAEPRPDLPLVAPGHIDLVLAPGLAFDRALWRLGRAGGYYDRYLANCGAFRLALTRELQIVEHVPHGAHDMRMDALLTELGYWQAESAEL